MDDVWGDADDVDFDRQMAERNWNRLQDTHGVAGYKDGVIEGKEAHIQAGFDQGYAQGVHIGHELGRLQGILAYASLVGGSLLAVLQVAAKDADVQRRVFKAHPTDEDLRMLRVLYGEIQSVTPDTMFTPDFFKLPVPSALVGDAANAAAAPTDLLQQQIEPDPTADIAFHEHTVHFKDKLLAALAPLVHDSILVAVGLS